MNIIKSRHAERRSNSAKRKRAEEGAELDTYLFFATAVKSSGRTYRPVCCDLLGGRSIATLMETIEIHDWNWNPKFSLSPIEYTRVGGRVTPQDGNDSYSSRKGGLEERFDCFNSNLLLLLLLYNVTIKYNNSCAGCNYLALNITTNPNREIKLGGAVHA